MLKIQLPIVITKLGLLIPLFVFINSCSKQVELSSEQQQFISEFKKEFKQPLFIDSTFIASLDTIENLEFNFIRLLSADSINETLAGGLKNSLSACLFIEEKKQNGRYANYLDSLDIGMLKNAMAFKIGKLSLDNNETLLLWGINEASFDADPGYSGISIIASYANHNKGFNHVLVGERYSAGDPPLFMEKKTNSELNKAEIRINSVTINEDSEVGSKLREGRFLKLRFQNGEIEIVQNVETK